MALSGQVAVHRPSALKQQNKKHNTLGHRTKGQIQALSKGRVHVKQITKSIKRELSKEQRKHQLKQIRSNKREEAVFKKRQLGTNSAPPFLVAIVPLCNSVNLKHVVQSLTNCDASLTSKISKQGILHLSSARLKQRFSFVLPPVGEFYATLDTVKVCDTILFVWKMGEEMDNWASMLLSSLMAQGLPSVFHAVVDDEEVSVKSKMRMEKNLQVTIAERFPSGSRLYFLNKLQDVNLILRQIGCQKQHSIFYRDQRSHMIAESVSFEGEGSTGTLKLQGYIRSQPMSVNRLIHIPGWGEFQISRMDIMNDPFPLELNRRRGKDEGAKLEEESQLLDIPDSSLQETLDTTYEVDPLDDDQTWPTPEEIEDAVEEHRRNKKKRVPKGTSDYQAAWYLPSDDDDSDVESSRGSMETDDCTPALAPSEDEDSEEEEEDEERDDDDDRTTLTDAADDDYDQQMDYEREMNVFNRMKAAKDDAAFPDEVDTPTDMGARVRFQKYRGLASFRTSTWDKNESLPTDYRRIMHFRNFVHVKRRVFKREREGAQAGWYVILHLKEVPRHLYNDQVASQSPFVAFSLLPFEQKMSLLNVALKSHPSGHTSPIKSKERLVFHVGFRRFANSPIFSEHSTGDKHKFFRFFQPGQTVVASMFAPITFPPCPVSVFREKADSSLELVALGSVLSADPDRIICKRVVLSGHPFKVNRKSATVRYMFYNPDDIFWFKSVELRTKWGKRGHIKEPLGTHGHMKCQFNGQLKSQDTVLMNLYKRVFPKWCYDPMLLNSPLLVSSSSQREDEEDLGSGRGEDIDQRLKKKRKVHFQP